MKFFATGAVALFLATPALAVDRTETVDTFTAVDISSGINAKIIVGGAQSVVASAPNQDELDMIKVEVKNGTLRAFIDWSIFDLFSFGEREINLAITVPALVTAEASSGADVDIDGMTGDVIRLRASSGADLNATHVTGTGVDADASSGADLDVDGSCDTIKANASSGADLDAENLVCKTGDFNASSGSDLDTFASVSAKANASSGAGITIHRKPPTLDQEESSGGDIEVKS